MNGLTLMYVGLAVVTAAVAVYGVVIAVAYIRSGAEVARYARRREDRA